MWEEKIKVLLGKPGLDGHDQGAKVVARALRDAGMEVVYTGLHQSPEQLVQAAIDEDVDVLGLSVLSGIHIEASKKVVDLLKKEDVKDEIVLLVGGTIPRKGDIDRLKAIGVDGVFPTDSSFDDIINFIKAAVKRKKGKQVG